MITSKMRENAQKITYLATIYPDKPMSALIDIIQLPAIQINAGIWAAVELGYIADPNEQEGMVQVISTPDYYFGETEEELEAHLIYCFSKLLFKEQDIEENYLSSWTNGYGSHDIIIAINHLIATNVIAEYEVEDAEKGGEVNAYRFYTSYETREQLWGKKQFKTEPIAPKPKKGKK